MVRYIRVQVAFVLRDYFGMEISVQQLMFKLAGEWRIVYGEMVNVIVNLGFIRREDLVFVMDCLIIIIVIGVI